MNKSLLAEPPHRLTLTLFGTFLVFLAVFCTLGYFWEGYLLLSFYELKGEGTVRFDGLGAVWTLFVWAIVTGTVSAWSYRSRTPHRLSAGALLRSCWASINAGVFEELIYRWLVLGIAAAGLSFLDYISHGFVQQVFTEQITPAANFVTFHTLESQLLNSNWLLGAAVVTAGSLFALDSCRSDWLGFINAWALGMIFSYLTFTYGLYTAIVAHVLYDALHLACAEVMSGMRFELRKRTRRA